MWTRKAQTLSTLQIVMNYPRDSGKTWAMINGVANTKDEAVVIAVNQAHAQRMKDEIKNPKVKFVSLDNLDQLRGNRLPVVVDHLTVSHVITYAFDMLRDMLRELQEENNLLKSDIYTLKHGNEDAKSLQNQRNKKTGKKVRHSAS